MFSDERSSGKKLRRRFDTSPLDMNAVCSGRTLRYVADMLGVDDVREFWFIIIVVSPS